jgi:hypothetical protein
MATPKVVIVIEGGCVRNVASDMPVNFIVLDQDTLHAGDLNGVESTMARNYNWSPADVDSTLNLCDEFADEAKSVFDALTGERRGKVQRHSRRGTLAVGQQPLRPRPTRP